MLTKNQDALSASLTSPPLITHGLVAVKSSSVKTAKLLPSPLLMVLKYRAFLERKMPSSMPRSAVLSGMKRLYFLLALASCPLTHFNNLDRLMAEGYLPSDGENVVFPNTKPNLAIKQPVPPPQCPTAKEATQPEIQAPEQSQSPPSTESDNGAPLASTSSSASNSNPNTAVSSPQVTTTPAQKTSPGQGQLQLPCTQEKNKSPSLRPPSSPLRDSPSDDKDIPATQRVAKICSLLGIQTPRYHLTPSQPPTDSTDGDLPSGWYFDGWVNFGQDGGFRVPWEVIEAASVKQVYGKKQAKERMAEKLLMWLMEEQRSRDQELGALLSGILAEKEGAS